MDQGLTVTKCVLIVWQKIVTQMLENLLAQFVGPSPKVLDFNEKRLHCLGIRSPCSEPFRLHDRLFSLVCVSK